MKLCAALMLSLSLAVGCGGDVDNEHAGASAPQGVPGTARPSTCDAPTAGCTDCLGCFDTITACMDAGYVCGPDCAAYLECAQTSTDPSCNALCCEPCRQAHPEGAAEAAALLACFTDQACAQACVEDGDALHCD